MWLVAHEHVVFVLLHSNEYEITELRRWFASKVTQPVRGRLEPSRNEMSPTSIFAEISSKFPVVLCDLPRKRIF